MLALFVYNVGQLITILAHSSGDLRMFFTITYIHYNLNNNTNQSILQFRYYVKGSCFGGDKLILPQPWHSFYVQGNIRLQIYKEPNFDWRSKRFRRRHAKDEPDSKVQKQVNNLFLNKLIENVYLIRNKPKLLIAADKSKHFDKLSHQVHWRKKRT